MAARRHGEVTLGMSTGRRTTPSPRSTLFADAEVSRLVRRRRLATRLRRRSCARALRPVPWSAAATRTVTGDHRRGAASATSSDRRRRGGLGGQRAQRRLHGIEPHPRRWPTARARFPRASSTGCSSSSVWRTSTPSRTPSTATTSTATSSAPASSTSPPPTHSSQLPRRAARPTAEFDGSRQEPRPGRPLARRPTRCGADGRLRAAPTSAGCGGWVGVRGSSSGPAAPEAHRGRRQHLDVRDDEHGVGIGGPVAEPAASSASSAASLSAVLDGLVGERRRS